MTSSSLKFKERMMQLHRAFLDPETGKTYKTECHSDIHSNCLERLNQDRLANGMSVISVPDGIGFDDWECRGYVHKRTGKFMSANEAVAWAEPDMSGSKWDGEGNHLSRIQERITEEMK